MVHPSSVHRLRRDNSDAGCPTVTLRSLDSSGDEIMNVVPLLHGEARCVSHMYTYDTYGIINNMVQKRK